MSFEIWYDQDRPEWVLLIRGTATLAYATGELRELQAGDYVLIESSVRHRVERVSPDAVWLALHHAP